MENPEDSEALNFETSIFAFDNRKDKAFLECAAEDSNSEIDGLGAVDGGAQNEMKRSNLMGRVRMPRAKISILHRTMRL